MQDGSPKLERLQRMIEDRLRSDVERAKAKYEAAGREDILALETFRAADPGSPDGNTAMRRGTAADVRARREYAEALAELSRFLTQGEVPARLDDLVKRHLAGEVRRPDRR